MANPINRELLEILACPKCKGGLEPTAEHDGLICRNCKLIYPVLDEIPIMMPEEAKPFE